MLTKQSPYCFVIMSFSEDIITQQAYARGIRAAVDGLAISCIRVDESHFQGRITDQIVNLIKGAYFVVADLSEERPNCYYELGYAHALGKVILPVIRKGYRIHFDLHDLPFIIYDTPEELSGKLRNRIVGAVLTSKERSTDDDPRRGEFGWCAVDLERGRILTAAISPAGKDKDYECDVHLEVRSLPGSTPLDGNVTLYLHSDYDPDHYNVKAKNGLATFDVEADGVYTVGVTADRRATRLELDLAKVPGGTAEFYAG